MKNLVISVKLNCTRSYSFLNPKFMGSISLKMNDIENVVSLRNVKIWAECRFGWN